MHYKRLKNWGETRPLMVVTDIRPKIRLLCRPRNSAHSVISSSTAAYTLCYTIPFHYPKHFALLFSFSFSFLFFKSRMVGLRTLFLVAGGFLLPSVDAFLGSSLPTRQSPSVVRAPRQVRSTYIDVYVG